MDVIEFASSEEKVRPLICRMCTSVLGRLRWIFFQFSVGIFSDLGELFFRWRWIISPIKMSFFQFIVCISFFFADIFSIRGMFFLLEIQWSKLWAISFSYFYSNRLQKKGNQRSIFTAIKPSPIIQHCTCWHIYESVGWIQNTASKKS